MACSLRNEMVRFSREKDVSWRGDGGEVARIGGAQATESFRENDPLPSVARLCREIKSMRREEQAPQ